MLRLPADDDAFERLLRRSASLSEASESVLTRVIALADAREAAPAAPAAVPRAGVLRRLVAAVGFDSGWALAPGVRGAGEVRQLLFSSEGRDIDLRIAPRRDSADARFEVAGQLFGPDVAGTVSLRGDGYAADGPWNDLAEFRFDDVPPGPLRLTLRSAEWEIELPVIDIAAASR
jgi:hypothetical protein